MSYPAQEVGPGIDLFSVHVQRIREELGLWVDIQNTFAEPNGRYTVVISLYGGDPAPVLIGPLDLHSVFGALYGILAGGRKTAQKWFTKEEA